MTLEQELLSWQVGYFILWVGFFILFFIVMMDERMRKKLQKHGTVITRKGTYTFTPHEVKNQ